MGIDELRERKEKLVDDLTKLIDEFEEDTGLSVEYLNNRKLTTREFGVEPGTLMNQVEVKVTV